MPRKRYFISETGYALVPASVPEQVVAVLLRSGYREVIREEYRRHQRRVANRVRREDERRWREERREWRR